MKTAPIVGGSNFLLCHYSGYVLQGQVGRIISAKNKNILACTDFLLCLFVSGLIQNLMGLIRMILLSRFHQRRYGWRQLPEIKTIK